MRRIAQLTERDLAAVLKRGFTEAHADLFASNGWIRSLTADEIQRDWTQRFPRMSGNTDGALLLKFNDGSPSLRPYVPPTEVLTINGRLIQRPCKYLYSKLLPGEVHGSNVQPWIPPAELGRPVAGTEGFFDALVSTYLIGIPTIGFTAPSHVRGSKIPASVKIYFSDSDVPYHHHPGLMPVVIGQCSERGLKLAHLPRFPGAEYAYTSGVIPDACKSGAEEWHREWLAQGLDPKEEFKSILKAALPPRQYLRSILKDFAAAGIRWPDHTVQIINAARAIYDADSSHVGRSALLSELCDLTGAPLGTARHQMLRRKSAAEAAAKKRTGGGDNTFETEFTSGSQSVIVPTINAETYPNTHQAREHRIISSLNRLEQTRTAHQKTNVLVVADSPGSGKTHTMANAWESILMGIDDLHFVYANPDYRNVDLETFPGFKSLKSPPSRHGGIVHYTSAGQLRYRRAKVKTLEEIAAGLTDDPELAEGPSCERIEEIEALMRKGAGPGLISDYCKQCPVRGTDKKNPTCRFVVDARDWSTSLRPSDKVIQVDESDTGALEQHEVQGTLVRDELLGIALLDPDDGCVRLQHIPDVLCTLPAVAALPDTHREKALLWIDESPQLFEALLQRVTIRRTDIGRWMASVSRWAKTQSSNSHPDGCPIPAEEQQLLLDGLQQLYALMDGFAEDLGPYGRDCPSIRKDMSPWADRVRLMFTDPLTGVLQLPEFWLADNADQLDAKEPEDHQENYPLRLGTLIRALLGVDTPAACHMLKAKNRKGADLHLHLTSCDKNMLDVIHSFRHVLITDATVDQHLLLQVLGGAEAVNMAAVKCAESPGADVRIHQIVDLGACGRSRRDSLKKRIDQVIAGIKQSVASDRAVAVLRPGDFASGDDGRWLTQDSRGGNQFQHADVLICDGLPRANVNASLSDYIALTGEQSACMGDPLFDAHQAVHVGSDLIQGIHRTRITRRPDDRVDIYILADADLSDLPWPVNHLSAEQFAPETRSDSVLRMHMCQATFDLKQKTGRPPSIRAVAAATGIPKSTVSRLASQASPHESWSSFRDLATADRTWQDPAF